MKENRNQENRQDNKVIEMKGPSPVLVELKAEAYDLFVSLEQHQANIDAYIKANINPLKERLVEVNKKINAENETARSSNS